jgi:hypothetical protein
MSHTSSRSSRATTNRRSARRRSRRLLRVARWLGGNAAYVLLGLAVLVTLATLAAVASRAPAQAADSASAQPAASSPHWITLRSQAPADILAAVRQSALFTVDRSGTGDYLKDVSHLSAPQLVTELRLTPTSPGVDSYVVPIRDRAGTTMGVAVAWLNPAHSAVYVGYIRSYDTPQPAWPGALPRADQAQAAVGAQRHTSLRAHAQAQLVYFPFDFAGQQAGRVHWNAGGQGPDTPVWLVPGADGQNYIVGTDGHAYTIDELPLAH